MEVEAMVRLQMDEVGARYEHCFDCLADAREWFMQLNGVVGVGVGPKERAKTIDPDDPVIIIYVREKKLMTELPAAELIPKAFYGAKTDVVQAGARAVAIHNDFDARWIDWARFND